MTYQMRLNSQYRRMPLSYMKKKKTNLSDQKSMSSSYGVLMHPRLPESAQGALVGVDAALVLPHATLLFTSIPVFPRHPSSRQGPLLAVHHSLVPESAHSVSPIVHLGPVTPSTTQSPLVAVNYSLVAASESSPAGVLLCHPLVPGTRQGPLLPPQNCPVHIPAYFCPA